ncbi:SusC/RagA family TonB-linked outer membrane protein [Niabella ginsenosidivorans]|uniref:SusC/RagA family TonB-linked outer membrane protein n=1 Tax=Niabella ginsenosidivorans TaxID=1176587 RepID=A0A1A9I7U9_9BACT|nr:SusC/RagA family TonB-linked outer membrane protein [Niabella ginsenosidivorans]
MRTILLVVFSFMIRGAVFAAGYPVSAGKAVSNGRAVPITGKVVDLSGNPMAGASVSIKGTPIGTLTGTDGSFTLNTPKDSGTLVVSYAGYKTQEVKFSGQSTLTISMEPEEHSENEVVVIGYGTKKRQDITSAISTVTSKDIDKVHGGSTVSTALAGKIPGVSFRQADGRPGSSANVQIRNFGTALYVIDGVQQDVGSFNNLAPGDIESISVLKDASASIYGLRAANGVVVVTTKKGKLGEKPTISFNGFYGIQSWTRFPEVLTSSYDYMRYKAEAEVNATGSTSITQEELDKYKAGTEYGYKSFDWRDFIIKNNSPLTSASLSAEGGSERITYYIAATHLYQNSPLGREYKFSRSNIQSNISAKIANGLKAGMTINGRDEMTQNPGVPYVDDYFVARKALMRNTPLERPYANDNPQYINDIKHNETNWAFLNYKNSGLFKRDWRVLQANLTLDYQPAFVKGLTLSGLYSYYIADEVLNNQEYTYDTYTYDPQQDTYTRTGGSTNPWREREQVKQINITTNIKLNYSRSFGLHTIDATLVNERIQNNYTRNWLHALPPFNSLSLIYIAQTDDYQDAVKNQPRIGYIGRLAYGYADKYNIELSGRRDASYLFPPDHRVGYFPSVSGAWRITNEKFIQNLLGEKTVLSELKLRASYGVMGDDGGNDNPIVEPFAYLTGYRYNAIGSVQGGVYIPGLVDKGIPVTNISWTKSKILDIGIDYNFLKGKFTGAVDYFDRRRTGILDSRRDVVVPAELGYNLPQENLNSDQQRGVDGSIFYNGKIGRDFTLTVGANGMYSRAKMLDIYKPNVQNALDAYRNLGIDRYKSITWGYEAIGQFQSQDEINNYPVDIDGRGNKTMLPGDIIYKDFNGDGKIDGNDLRPIGYGNGGGVQPIVNYGLSINLSYKQLDFTADFSGAAGYTWIQSNESLIPFFEEGNLNTIFLDRWHHQDPLDPNSPWVPGKYPALRFNPNGGDNPNYRYISTFYTHNIKYLRARTIELGYSLPAPWVKKIKATRARVYVNAYNLFSIDNMKQFGLDPEIDDNTGLQIPQSRVFNIGVNLTF